MDIEKLKKAFTIPPKGSIKIIIKEKEQITAIELLNTRWEQKMGIYFLDRLIATIYICSDGVIPNYVEVLDPRLGILEKRAFLKPEWNETIWNNIPSVYGIKLEVTHDYQKLLKKLLKEHGYQFAFDPYWEIDD